MCRLQRRTRLWIVGLVASAAVGCGSSPTRPTPNPGGSGITTLVVTPPVGLLPGDSLTAGVLIVLAGNPGTLTAPVTWSSSNTSIVTVTANGTVTGIAPGTAMLTASAQGISGSSLVTVYQDSDLLGVTIQMCAATLQVGQATGCSAVATLRGAGAVPVASRAAWTSTNPAVAMVSGGLVIAKSSGQTQLSVSFHGQSASTTLTVSGGDADFVRVDAIPQQGVFRRGSAVTLWLVGFYSLVSGATGNLAMQVSDQNNTIAVSSMPVTRGGDGFVLQTQFTIPADATRICPIAVMRVGSVVTAQDPADGLRFCIAITQ